MPKSIPMIFCHGDFKFSNFIFESTPDIKLTGLIDWEYSLKPGLPGYDLFYVTGLERA